MTDPYAKGMIPDDPYSQRRSTTGTLVAVMRLKLAHRGLQLIPIPSRALRTGDVHELIVTATRAEPGDQVDEVAYLGFFEVEHGAILKQGDRLIIDGHGMGEVLGFDETHMPNHLNIVIRTDDMRSGEEQGLKLEMAVVFEPV